MRYWIFRGGHIFADRRPNGLAHVSASRKWAACSLIWWKSANLRKKVGSTLAAETQSLLTGLGELIWAKAIHAHAEIAEAMDPEFSVETFREGAQAQADIVLQLPMQTLSLRPPCR